jgi:uncharacterized Zn finger protein
MPHLISELVLVPSEQQLKAAAKLSVQVHAAKGRLEAVVGNGTQRETAVLKVKPIGDKEWRKVIEAVAVDTGATARLVSGQFGPEVEAAFDAAGAPLFPELPMGAIRCTCKEGNGCRHVLALLLTATVHLDENPYLWTEVLGRPRAGLLAAVQAKRRDETAPPSAESEKEEGLSAERFWETDVDPGTVPVRPGGEGAAPDSLLRRLGPLPLAPEQAAVELLVEQGARQFRQARPIDEVLRAYVAYVGEAAGALARGDLPPRYPHEPLPGKAVGAPARLVPEIELALATNPGWVTVDDLARRSPTANHMADPALGRSAVQEALPLLPATVLTVGGRYLCRRSEALAGAAFRHVITWDEQVQGRLTRDADWVRALHACGAAAPFAVQAAGRSMQVLHPAGPELFYALEQPRVGDELWVQLTDPARPVLAFSLRRREERRLAADESAAAAAQTLLRHTTLSGHLGVAEEEAVAVLLAGGHYRRRGAQDEAWTLPLYGVGLGADRKGRYLVADQHPAPPALGRRPGVAWPDQEQVLRGVSGVAAAVARWWCEYCPGPQDRPEALPDLALLQEFLWLRAPQAAVRRGIPEGDLPGGLIRWFRHLERLPRMADACAAHRAVCGDAEAYAHRVATLQAASDDAAMRAWLLEGYRWIGESRCWATGAWAPAR